MKEDRRNPFQNEQIALFLRKEGFSIVFEGDTLELEEANGIMKPFWDLFEKNHISRFFLDNKKRNRIYSVKVIGL